MDIQDLIATKRKQISLLERHIKMLEEIAAEESSISTDGLGRRGKAPGGKRKKVARRRRGRGNSRASMIEKYLKSHSGPQPAKEIAAALSMKPAEVHGAIHAGLKSGRFVRGKERASYGLGGAGKAVKSTKKRVTRSKTKRGRKRTARAIARGEGQTPQPGV